MYGNFNNQYPPNDSYALRVDRNYYDRVRNNNYQQPPYDPYARDPYRGQPDPRYNPPPRGTYADPMYNDPYGRFGSPPPTRRAPIGTYGYGSNASPTSICDTGITTQPYSNVSVAGNTTSCISVPDYTVATPVEEPVCEVPDNNTPRDILDVIKELKARGYTPTPDSVKIPLYDENKFTVDAVIKGDRYTLIVIPK